jgi:hypothetical protein
MRYKTFLASILAANLTAMAALAEEPVCGSPSPQPAREEAPPANTLKRAGWITAGSGAVLMAGGTLAWLVGEGRADKVRGHLDAGQVDAAKDDRRAADRYEVTGQILLAVGAAAAATGLTLVLVAPKAPRDKSVELAALPQGILLTGSF